MFFISVMNSLASCENQNNMVSIYYQNVNGIRSIKKRDNLMQSREYPIICLSDTNLNNTVPDSSILHMDYRVYRADRTDLTSNKKRKGGVLIGVHTDFSPSKIDVSESRFIEFICVKIELQKSNLFICCSYISPEFASDRLLKHLIALGEITSMMKKDDQLVLTGDFNLPNNNWRNGDKIENDSFLNLGLIQYNNILNDSGKILDLVFAKQTDGVSVQRANGSLVHPEEGHHPPLHISLDIFDFYNNIE